jgi:hypothetical protein
MDVEGRSAASSAYRTSCTTAVAADGFAMPAKREGGWHICNSRSLTFELRRDRRQSARPGGGMINLTWSRAWRFAVGPRLERGVRRHREADDGAWAIATRRIHVISTMRVAEPEPPRHSVMRSTISVRRPRAHEGTERSQVAESGRGTSLCAG